MVKTLIGTGALLSLLVITYFFIPLPLLRPSRPDIPQERTAIQELQVQQTKARTEIAILKQRVKDAEARAQAWQLRAQAQEEHARTLGTRVRALEADRLAMRALVTVEEKWEELRRLGF